MGNGSKYMEVQVCEIQSFKIKNYTVWERESHYTHGRIARYKGN